MKAKSERPRVLVVDDYPDAREMYAEYLQYSGFDVIEAGNGMEALERAAGQRAGHHPDGPVAAGHGRLGSDPAPQGDKATADIPIVALTGHALAGILEGAKKAGCDAFVTKPCLPEDLVKEIQKVLNGPVDRIDHESPQERQICENQRLAPARPTGPRGGLSAPRRSAKKSGVRRAAKAARAAGRASRARSASRNGRGTERRRDRKRSCAEAR